jgi:hypothetical protein
VRVARRRASSADFDVDLATLDPRCVEGHQGAPDAKLIVLIGVAGQDAERSLAQAHPAPLADRAANGENARTRVPADSG